MTFTGRQSSWCWRVLLTGAAVFAMTGCGGTEKLTRVAGKVTVDGQPLKAGSVCFRPDASHGNTSPHQPSGPIDAEGNYELSVPPERKGAPLGWYKVVVIAYDNPRPGNLKSLIPTKYGEEKSTPLKVEVIEKPEPSRYDLKLTR
jgi:hypothetical protein